MKKVLRTLTLSLALSGAGQYSTFAQVMADSTLPTKKELAKIFKTAPLDSTDIGKKIKFSELEHNFGDIKQGDVVTTTFYLKNTSDSIVVIEDARASCGCTVPSYKKGPIGKGEYASIKATFNSTGKSGRTEKTITVRTTAGTKVLKLKSNISTVSGTPDSQVSPMPGTPGFQAPPPPPVAPAPPAVDPPAPPPPPQHIQINNGK
jgi:hypothetical protein